MLHERDCADRDSREPAYYVAFGPHGPRAPLEVNTGKTIGGVVAALGAASVLFYLMRKNGESSIRAVGAGVGPSHSSSTFIPSRISFSAPSSSAHPPGVSRRLVCTLRCRSEGVWSVCRRD